MSNRATSTASKPPLYKIVMLGDSGVGKTSLVARLTNPSAPLNHDISATMGIEFDTQLLDTPHGRVKAQIWDTAGQERFARVLLPTYFRKARGVVLVFDTTSLKSLESLGERWMVQLCDHANSDDLAKLLVGNKCDLVDQREVSTERAMAFCKEYGMEYIETSAKSGSNVLEAFEKLVSAVHERGMAGNSGGGGGSGGAGGRGGGGAGGSGGREDGASGGALKLDSANARGGPGAASANAAASNNSCGC
jgi:small GTP-binding protein